ncbi:MAG: Fic family protein [Gemmatimonadetes bacterium]|nr:Fic family protein [Gemmatimonadota bacterium]
MHSLTAARRDSILLTQKQASALRALGEARGRQELYTHQRAETLAALRTLARIESTEASNKLEGITAPAARVKGIVTGDATPRNRSEEAIAGYRDALRLIHESYDELAVSEDVIRELHRMIHAYQPDAGGSYKTADNTIREWRADGSVRVRFTPVSASETPDMMRATLAAYHEADQDGFDPLLAIPLLALDFLCVHPFADGNGRVSRLLALLALYQAGYEVGRYISMERVFWESRETYYEALEKSSRGWHDGEHDIMPWLTYFWGVLTRGYGEFETRVGAAEGRGHKSGRVRAAIERQVAPFKMADIERECPDVSRATIRKVFREMKSAGAIDVTGRGPGARWRRVT